MQALHEALHASFTQKPYIPVRPLGLKSQSAIQSASLQVSLTKRYFHKCAQQVILVLFFMNELTKQELLCLLISWDAFCLREILKQYFVSILNCFMLYNHP